ncbi:ABC transporter permease [Chitiniphilus shinanonensis]|uniref:ABC transporter permease n=1 Tax=Chitiniphilus shinanonensis TaxID=553088 RepID=UPI0006865659|nr:ABC transporter permease [Chitiniphilus shinanonensis]
MQSHSYHPRELVASAWRNRALLKASIRREVLGRYRGSLMGILWSFFNPLFMLIVYTFVFSVIFKSRWNSQNDSKTEFALVLFAGQIIFNFFSECINRAPSLILSNPNYVKKVVYPLEILPWISIGAALFHTAISILVWLFGYSIFFGIPHLTSVYLLFVLAPLILMVIGLSWALASLGVFLRDVGQFIGVITTVVMFLSPIFYPVSAIPEKFRHLIYINPLTPIIEMTRDVLYWGKMPDLQAWLISSAISGVVAWIGFIWFQKTRKGFADVM